MSDLTSFRALIETKARSLGAEGKIFDKNDIDAVRTIQQHEGFSPCFATATTKCATQNCSWYQTCMDLSNLGDLNSHPKGTVPVYKIEQVMPNLRKFEVDQIIESFGKLSTLYKGRRSPALAVGNPLRFNDTLKKMLIVTDSFSFCDRPKDHARLCGYLLSAVNANYHQYKSTGTNMEYRIIFASDLPRLLPLLSNMRSFTAAGKVNYYSEIVHIATGDQISYYNPSARKQLSSSSQLGCYFKFPEYATPKFPSTPFIASPDDDVAVSAKELVPLMELEIPAIENTTFNDLHRIIKSNPDSFELFRNFLLNSLEELYDSALGSEQFYRDLSRIERRIRNELNGLRAQLLAGKIKAYTNILGGAMALCTLSIVCILSDRADVLKLLGPGGAVYTLSSACGKYLAENVELKKNPVHFLWLLSKSHQ